MGFSPVTAQILLHRGIDTPDAAHAFLRIEIGQLRDPFEIPGMEAAVDRLGRALSAGESIGIFGDYDVDGVSGTALLTRFFRLHGREVPAYIPHRTQEGYGINDAGIAMLAERGVKLLVTVDTGTSAFEPIARARERGMDVIVLDHHAPDASLPAGAIVVNPMLGKTPNPLASVGVAFKTAWALAPRAPDRAVAEFLPGALSLAAMGTVADVCPLTGDNRVLVALGLEHINTRPLTGVAAILRSAGLEDEELSAGDIGFKIAPRLNAAGRMLTASTALEILLTSDATRAAQLAAELELANRKRQKIEEDILNQAVERIESGEGAGERVIVLADDRWHSGVVGIVAARLVDRYSRPVFIIGMEGAMGRGSARTVEGFNLKDAISRCEDLLISGGGHAKAGGLSIAREKLEPFIERMRAVARERLTDADLVQSLSLDLEVELGELGAGTLREFDRLAPFGIGNPRPALCARGARVAGQPKVMGRDGKHLTFIASQGEASWRAVGWSMADRLDELLDAERIDLAFTVEANTWAGKTNLEMILKDFKASG
jgi:single-stranded-DNA-specific exonuclease